LAEKLNLFGINEDWSKKKIEKKLIKNFKNFIKMGVVKSRDKDTGITMTWCP